MEKVKLSSLAIRQISKCSGIQAFVKCTSTMKLLKQKYHQLQLRHYAHSSQSNQLTPFPHHGPLFHSIHPSSELKSFLSVTSS